MEPLQCLVFLFSFYFFAAFMACFSMGFHPYISGCCDKREMFSLFNVMSEEFEGVIVTRNTHGPTKLG